MHAASEFHKVDEVLPPAGSDLLLFLETGQLTRGTFHQSADRAAQFKDNLSGGILTPSHWAFFNAPRD